MRSGGPVNLQPPQRSVPEDYRKPTSGSFTTVTQRQPSAGRKPPPGKALLPEFPRRDEGPGYRQGSLATGLGGSSYAVGSSTGAVYAGIADARSSTTTGSYVSSSAPAARSTSVPRPSSRTASGAPVAGAVSSSGHAAGAATSGPGGVSSHQSPRGATRTPVTPGSILDTLKTPSVLPGGTIASLAQRMNSSSGWDYSTLAGGATGSSTLRLKRQAGATAADLASPVGGAASHVQQHYSALSHATDQLRAVYVSGPVAGSSGSGAVTGLASTPTAPAGAGRRVSAERPPAERGSMSRTNSFSSQGGSGYTVAAGAAAAAAGSAGGGHGTPSAPPLPASYLQEASQQQQQQQQQPGQPAPQRLAAGTVYASQYAPQYGNSASTVYIPYSSQHGSASREGSVVYGGGSGPQGASAPPYGSGGSSAYGGFQGTGTGPGFASHSAYDRTSGAGHYMPATVVGGGTGSSQQPTRPSALNVGPSTQLPPFLSASSSPSSANAPSAPPLVPPTVSNGTPLSTPQLYQAASPHAPLAAEYVSRSLQRTASNSAVRSGAGGTSAPSAVAAGAPSAPPLPPTGPPAGAGRLRTLTVTTADEDGAVSGDGGSNSSLRRLQAQEEQRRCSATGVASPLAAAGAGAGYAGGGSGTLSPKSMASYHLGTAALGDSYQQHPHAQYHNQQQQQQQQQQPQQQQPQQQQPQQQQPQQPRHAQQYHQQQQQHTHSGSLPAGAALDAGGSSYTSNASSTNSTTTSKSSVAVAGTGMSSASTSRTTSSISQRSVTDALAQQHQHQPQPPQPQAGFSSSSQAHGHGRHVGSDRAANGRVGGSYASYNSDTTGSQDSDVRSSSETINGAARRASSVTDAGSGTGAGPGALQERGGAPVCGPLPDLPVVVAPRDVQPGRGCVGLQNLGNTCFMNSILQSLNAVPELVQQFLNPSERHWSSKAVVAPAYSGLVRDMMAGSLGGCVNPSAFLRKVSKHDSRWGDGRQQDSQEFLNSLLEALQSECNRITTKPVYRELQGKGSEEAQALEAFNYARSWNDSVVDDIFGGLTQSTIQCHACKRVSHTFEPFLGLAVPIPSPQGQGDREGGHVTVADCLRAFVECEELEGDDSYKCEACKRRQPHSKRLQIFRPPRVLVLTLKRFAQRPAAPGFFSRFRSPAKNNTPVRLDPEPLDLTSYCNPFGLRGMCVRGRGSVAPVYQLVAVSHHSGSLEGGHYTAQARSCLDGQWYNFNDSSVRREPARPSGASSSAYVLFYRLATLPSSSL